MTGLGYVLVPLLLLSPGASWAGGLPRAPVEVRQGVEQSDPVLEAGEAHRAAWQPARALAVWDAALTVEPRRYAVLWRAAREAVVLGILADDEDTQNRWFSRGEDYARRGVEVDPIPVEARYWLAAARGRRALQAGVVTAARLALQIHEGASRILEEDEEHAGAHHVMGVLNSEVMKLPAVTRFFGRRVLGGGTDLYETSWEDAEHHLTRAVDLEPGMLLYRLDLALMYLRQERMDEAARELRQILELPTLEAVDAGIQRQASTLLQRAGSGP